MRGAAGVDVPEEARRGRVGDESDGSDFSSTRGHFQQFSLSSCFTLPSGL